MLRMYENARSYLLEWTAQFDKFKIFEWMNIDRDITFDDIEPCIEFLRNQNVEMDDVKCFDQLTNLREFIADHKNDDDYKENLAHEKWVKFFSMCTSIEQYSELEIIAQYFFAIPAHNANVERIFSLISAQWTDERNRLLVDSIKNLAIVKYNFKNISCVDFFQMILKDDDFLNNVKTKEKYIYKRRRLNED